MARDSKTVKAPSLALLATEGRGLLDIPALLAAAPFLATAPRGQPHPVMVLPGLGADRGPAALLEGVPVLAVAGVVMLAVTWSGAHLLGVREVGDLVAPVGRRVRALRGR